jgi:hypothetical protein
LSQGQFNDLWGTPFMFVMTRAGRVQLTRIIFGIICIVIGKSKPKKIRRLNNR